MNTSSNQGAAAIGNAEADWLRLRSCAGRLEAGTLRSAEPDATEAIGLAGECVGEAGDSAGISAGAAWWRWRAWVSRLWIRIPIRRRQFAAADGVRVVPGGSSVRAGAYLAKGVVCMPPMYVNVGAYVDEGTMVDSHALVGSCAQIGKRVHLSAAAQIGGVLEPVNASPGDY